jgi:hypothetical protein
MNCEFTVTDVHQQLGYTVGCIYYVRLRSGLLVRKFMIIKDLPSAHDKGQVHNILLLVQGDADKAQSKPSKPLLRE